MQISSGAKWELGRDEQSFCNEIGILTKNVPSRCWRRFPLGTNSVTKIRSLSASKWPISFTRFKCSTADSFSTSFSNSFEIPVAKSSCYPPYDAHNNLKFLQQMNVCCQQKLHKMWTEIPSIPQIIFWVNHRNLYSLILCYIPQHNIAWYCPREVYWIHLSSKSMTFFVRLMAMIRPSGSFPLYTVAHPPWPILDASEKLAVILFSSAIVKINEPKGLRSNDGLDEEAPC